MIVNIFCESLLCKSSTCDLFYLCHLWHSSSSIYIYIYLGHKIGVQSGSIMLLLKLQCTCSHTFTKRWNIEALRVLSSKGTIKVKLFWNSLELLPYPNSTLYGSWEPLARQMNPLKNHIKSQCRHTHWKTNTGSAMPTSLFMLCPSLALYNVCVLFHLSLSALSDLRRKECSRHS